jgi:hypothetical protein
VWPKREEDKGTRRQGDKGRRRQGDKGRGRQGESDLFWFPCLFVSLSPPLLVSFWGGEVNLRFYPNQPGLPRKPIPFLAISTALEPTYVIKNANFLAFLNKQRGRIFEV